MLIRESPARRSLRRFRRVVRPLDKYPNLQFINPKNHNLAETRNVTVEAASETFLDRISPFPAPCLLSQRTSELGGDWHAWRGDPLIGGCCWSQRVDWVINLGHFL
jgi:hypothetical protein